jgi:hypothetical protein
MNEEHAKALAAGNDEVERLKKRVSYWQGRVTAELNKVARAEYIKATAPRSDEAFMFCTVSLQNMRTMAENYQAVANSYATRLAKAKEALRDTSMNGPILLNRLHSQADRTESNST